MILWVISLSEHCTQSAAVECLRRTAKDNPEYTKLNSFIQRQIAAGIKIYPDRPRRIETFNWGNEDEDKKDDTKVAILIADLLNKKIGPVEKAFLEYLKSSSALKLSQLVNQIDVTGNGKIEYAEYRNWVHNFYPALCR